MQWILPFCWPCVLAVVPTLFLSVWPVCAIGCYFLSLPRPPHVGIFLFRVVGHLSMKDQVADVLSLVLVSCTHFCIFGSHSVPFSKPVCPFHPIGQYTLYWY